MSKLSKVTGLLSAAGALSFRSKTNDVNLLTLDPADNRVRVDRFFGFGAAEQATVASGVLTVTKSYVNVLPQTSTTDTVDSIVFAAAEDGDILICTSAATNTITFDNATGMLLGAGTRAVAPGGCIGFLKVGATNWVEIFFLTAAS